MIRLRAFWRNLRHRARVERELDDEMRATIELLVAERVRTGMAPEQARRAAMLELGGVESVKQQVREVRRGAYVETIVGDVRYAARLLWKNPLFTLTAVFSLAIGIGATTSIFTVANGLLLRAAAGVSDPGTLVDIVRRNPAQGPGVELMSYPHLLDLRRNATTLEHVYGYQLQLTASSLSFTDGAATAFVSVATSNFFRAIGVGPSVGRVFDSGDSEQLETSPIAVLSHRFWMRRFGGDAAVVGQTARINNTPVTIVGVAAEGFNGLSVLAPDVWLPVSMITAVSPEGHGQELTNRRMPWLAIGARLKAGATRAQASAQVAGIGAALQREAPIMKAVTPDGFIDIDSTLLVWSAEIASPIPYGIRILAATFLALLMALVAVVLVIACANLAGVLLARATGRKREIAVRSAIGAARSRLVRQLLTETTLLFVLGGLAGLAMARAITMALLTLLPSFPLPANLSVPLDGRVVLFALTLSFVAAVLAGLAPALHAVRSDVVSALKDDSQGPSDRLRLRNAFVVAQVAFSILLIVVAGLFVRAFDNVVSVNQGFDPRNVEVISLDLRMGGYTDATGRDVVRRLREQVAAIPGVERASIADRAPGAGVISFGNITVPGAAPVRGRRTFTNWMIVEPGYFAALGIPILAGRDFAESDSPNGERVAIVSQQTAKRLWPDREPIGQLVAVVTPGPAAEAGAPTLHSGDGSRPPTTQLRVVGVAGEVNVTGQSGDAAPDALYVPFAQRYRPEMAIVVRRDAGRPSLVQDVRNAINAVDANLPVLSADSLELRNDGPVQTQLRISATVAGSVGLIGLFLAGIGIYGVTAYAVTQRTREIGIRLSLGAGQGEVVRLILAQGMRLVVIGSAIGLALGLAAGKLISGRQFGILQADPLVLIGSAFLFGLVGLVACYVPVRRASTIRAIEALRYE
jgi:putative ABC transport system permease protein